MSKNLSSKYYQENKDYKKSNNMIVNITKISQKMQNKSLLSIEKGYRMKKIPIIITNICFTISMLNP